MLPRTLKKAKSGSVRIRNSNDRLQLVFTFAKKRYFISTGLSDIPYHRKLAQDKALEVERDIAYGNFDSNNTDKYKVTTALSESEEILLSDPIPILADLWDKYTTARSTDKSPCTLRMYGWVANHLKRCPFTLPTESQAIFDWLNAHVPADSAKRVLMHLSACCRWAKKSGIIDSNPFDGYSSEIKLKKRGTQDEEINPFSRDERDRLIEAFKNSRHYNCYAPLVQFLFLTGCRPSEGLALSWGDIHKNFISFNQSVVHDGSKIVCKDGLKTQLSRKFPINDQLRELLESIKPSEASSKTLVFSNQIGKYIDWSNFTSRAWKKVMASLPDINYRNPYQTRHTFCSLCREANIPSIQVAKWVGNSAQMIDRVYAKPVDNVDVPRL